MNDTYAYCQVVSKLRDFFYREKNFLEVPTQAKSSILSACEDPKTITFYEMSEKFPLPQTGQMWLEYELLTRPEVDGYFCLTTSYRNEPNPIEGRHQRIFPMFEFESHGGMDELRKLEQELLDFLGLGCMKSMEYDALCEMYQTSIIEAEHEERLYQEQGSAISLELFPQRSDPFWNMKKNSSGTFNKIDVILHGMETIGSAERSVDVSEMREGFHSIAGGSYAATLFKAFGERRVMDELNEYLSLPMIPRFGGGIGINRLIRSMELAGLLMEDHHRHSSLRNHGQKSLSV